MYSNKKNINILTSLLVAHGIRHAVVCPGSRNAPIVHNLNAHPKIKCYPVTDERSAGFFAMGVALATHHTVAVCVTSGSALLNLAPAVAEAHEQHVGIVVISADRPQQWIEQLDGQTIPQPNAFNSLVNKSVTLPENITNEEDHWYCNRLVNEALLATLFPINGPVHINVPIAEPLFEFTVDELPEERTIRRYFAGCDGTQVIQWILDAKKPMVVMGQYVSDTRLSSNDNRTKAIQLLGSLGVLLSERLCHLSSTIILVDEALSLIENEEEYLPDLIVYFGGMVVSKRLRQFMRKAKGAKVVMINQDGNIHDVSMHLTDVVQMRDIEELFHALLNLYDTNLELKNSETYKLKNLETLEYHLKWETLLRFARNFAYNYQPAFSQMATVKYFEEQLADIEYDFHVHYANSMPIRLANIYAEQPVYCNRGVNGIEGSLSTAVGFAATTDDKVFCIVGDLSFFYDQNALWNQNLGGNLRIILLNNDGGGIFSSLKGLEQNEERKQFIAGEHHTQAQGICAQNDVGYLKARNMEEMQIGIVTLLTKETVRPLLLEVQTDMETDAMVINDYYQHMKQLWQKENGKQSGNLRK
ncbi:MAG: 2-succinyl-5-enolpyruvyl-6-hydroxy-3-cyclohexene-1-carboxylic-acid synthase [Prevotella sp.]|nr:2-succinyl-5-enolpyruvyl-6-hydroxy-3-cyclohexene-1-carboxylic-acid synthase [Prevotella sp.]